MGYYVDTDIMESRLASQSLILELCGIKLPTEGSYIEVFYYLKFYYHLVFYLVITYLNLPLPTL